MESSIEFYKFLGVLIGSALSIAPMYIGTFLILNAKWGAQLIDGVFFRRICKNKKKQYLLGSVLILLGLTCFTIGIYHLRIYRF